MSKKAPFVGTRRGGQIVAALRRLYLYSPERRAASNAAFKYRDKGIEYYECQICKEVKPRKETQVDHEPPVVGPEGIQSWDAFITRLFSNHQRRVCKPCHRVKTNGENSVRRGLKKRLR